MSTNSKRAIRLAAAFAVMVVVAVAVRGASSTNFELDLQTTPGAGDDSFSTNYHLVGMAPQDPAGDVRTSTNYQLETIFVPDTYDPIDTTPPVIQTGPTVVYTSNTSALIEWTTDEIADGSVDYGLTAAYGSTAVQSGGFSTLHQVLLTGLTASTTYNFRVNSTDPYANGPTQSGNAQFTTAGTPDITGPTINETVTATSTQSVDIDFTTNEYATSVVDHGPTAALGTSLPDSVFRTNHTRSISGLTPGSTLFYEVTADDPSGNGSTTGVQTFVVPDDVTITTLTLPNAQVGSTYSQLLNATGGVGALTWSLDSGTLPAGIVLVGATGELSGIPTSGGVFVFSIRATDSGTPASTDVVSLQLTIGGGGTSSGSGSSGGGGCATSSSHASWLFLLLLASGLGTFAIRRRIRSAL